jgi:hypothetical protein
MTIVMSDLSSPPTQFMQQLSNIQALCVQFPTSYDRTRLRIDTLLPHLQKSSFNHLKAFEYRGCHSTLLTTETMLHVFNNLNLTTLRLSTCHIPWYNLYCKGQTFPHLTHLELQTIYYPSVPAADRISFPTLLAHLFPNLQFLKLMPELFEMRGMVVYPFDFLQCMPNLNHLTIRLGHQHFHYPDGYWKQMAAQHTFPNLQTLIIVNSPSYRSQSATECMPKQMFHKSSRDICQAMFPNVRTFGTNFSDEIHYCDDLLVDIKSMFPNLTELHCKTTQWNAVTNAILHSLPATLQTLHISTVTEYSCRIDLRDLIHLGRLTRLRLNLNWVNNKSTSLPHVTDGIPKVILQMEHHLPRLTDLEIRECNFTAEFLAQRLWLWTSRDKKDNPFPALKTLRLQTRLTRDELKNELAAQQPSRANYLDTSIRTKIMCTPPPVLLADPSYSWAPAKVRYGDTFTSLYNHRPCARMDARLRKHGLAMISMVANAPPIILFYLFVFVVCVHVYDCDNSQLYGKVTGSDITTAIWHTICRSWIVFYIVVIGERRWRQLRWPGGSLIVIISFLVLKELWVQCMS